MRALLALLLLACAASVAQARERVWNFRVLLDGQEIGGHRFMLRSAGESSELRSEASFDVRFLFISAYKYQHKALERWEGDCLSSLVSQTQTNSENQTVNAQWRDGRLRVERSGTREEHEGCVMSFAYWNPQVLAASRLLNSQTGEWVPISISKMGEEAIAVRGQRLAAQRHRISGPKLQIDLWYAGSDWVALEALAQGGRRMRYELL
jgi:hypothetical protein